METTLNSHKIKKLLYISALFLILIHISLFYMHFYTKISLKPEFVRMFNLDAESNLPTLFSFSILLFSAFLFYLLSKEPAEQEKGNRLYWLGLAFVFTFLACDEAIMIHEAVSDVTEIFVHGGGYLYYPWVLPYTILLAILGFFYIRFFLRMERALFLRFMIAAVLYISGAVGFEMLGSKESRLHSMDTVLYTIYSTVEESLEIFGVLFLIGILLKILGNTEWKLKLRF